MAAYQLVDLTYVAVNLTHSVSFGECPVCKVSWAQRPDRSCDCFFLGSQTADERKEHEAWLRQSLANAIQVLYS
jgi:hypothetical protein